MSEHIYTAVVNIYIHQWLGHQDWVDSRRLNLHHHQHDLSRETTTATAAATTAQQQLQQRVV